MRSFHITFDADVEQDQLEDALRNSDLLATQVRSVTPLTDGYAFTDTFVCSVWATETNSERCRCKTEEEKERHLYWDELTERQQRHFLFDLTEFLNVSRYEHYEIRGLAKTDLFDGIALQCDAYG